MTTLAPKQDGWYPDTDMETYLAWPVVSGSVLGVFAGRTPLHVYHALHYQDQDAQTAVFQLGSLTHTAVLEPDKLEAEYYVLPDPDPTVYTTKTGEPSKNPAATRA